MTSEYDSDNHRNPIRYFDARILAEKSDFDNLIKEYRVYRDDPFRIILRRFNYEKYTNETIAVLGSKRGNPVYNHRLRKKLRPIRDYPDHLFFDYKDRSNRHKTKALFVDYTYPTSVPLKEAFDKIGIDLNRQLSLIRSRYGEFSAFRVFEIHTEKAIGYPHIHLVLIFRDYEFETFFYRSPNVKKGSWRIQERDNVIWSEGFSDVQAVSSMRGALRYCSKYMSKTFNDSPSYFDELTHALMWAFHKRSYSVSGDFLDLIKTMSNSNKSIKLIQMNLEGASVLSDERLKLREKWVLIGFYRGLLLGNKWYVAVSLSKMREIRESENWYDPRPPLRGGGLYH